MRLLVLIGFGLLMGCASKPPLEQHMDFAPVRPLEAQTLDLPTGSILANNAHMSLFQGQRKWKIGDIVTIVLSEATQASRNASLITERKANNNALNATWNDVIAPDNGFWGAVVPTMDLSGVEVGSEGTGTAAQANTLTGVITAMVTEVMPNGNLIVEGRKQLSLTEGAEFVQVRGIVRARDIQADNTIPSMRMAQAQISYRGTGNLAESTQPGWLSQLIFMYWPR
jgi:flagellar L-ring protein precursor FlgH